MVLRIIFVQLSLRPVPTVLTDDFRPPGHPVPAADHVRRDPYRRRLQGDQGDGGAGAADLGQPEEQAQL